jgi:CofD-related protein of GAK system
MPAGFDLRGANIGNLILAGGYLNQDRDIDSVVYLFSKLVEVRGVVRPITDENLHLVAELEDGEVVVGQHRLTGKEEAPPDSPIQRLFLSQGGRDPSPYVLDLREKIRRLIESADLICYPMGSFYSSLLVNLLPRGIGRAVAALDAPKVYVPNTGRDPEQLGLSLAVRIERLLDALREGEEEELPTERLLSHVLVDAAGAGWQASDLAAVAQLGVRVIDTPLTRRTTAPMIDAERLAQVLVSMA